MHVSDEELFVEENEEFEFLSNDKSGNSERLIQNVIM